MFKQAIGYLFVALAVLSLGWYSYDSHQQLVGLQGEMSVSKDKDQQDLMLGQYTINMMYQTRAATLISDAKKQVLARAIVHVADDVFEAVEHKKAFIAILAIESEFQRSAQSPTGPKGLTQVAKAAFQEGMANCGVTSLNADDVWETDLNLYAGACYFRALMEQNGNDPYIAIVAYNQGPASKDIKTYAKSGRLESTEGLKYIARFNFLKQKVTEKKAPDAPAVQTKVVKPSSKSSKISGK